MLTTILRKVFGNRNERILKQLQKTVIAINQLEPRLKSLSDAQLRAKTDEFRARLQKGETLQKILPEAFAVVREASQRVFKMRHFDVQLIGGMVLNSGKIAEMRTGEGKTLSATLPAYLNALSGHGVHIITVNDYLAKRDAEWMGPLYSFLSLTVGVIISDLSQEERKIAYLADITYGTNNEFGFDYLRDNMVFRLQDKVQRELNFAIVDEVDSILIDEARTPLVISGPSDESSELYIKINNLIPQLKKREAEDGPGDFYLDEKTKQAYLTETGHQRVEELLIQAELLEEGDSPYAANNIVLIHHLYASLRAHYLFHRDVDYITRDNQIIIVDEHTGRLMDGRRWSDGLHQAVEAKEGLSVQNENQTLASITFQNYFRLYQKLAGMTGTADTEAYEFHQIYGLEVVVIPTNQPINRSDMPDQIYLTEAEKFNAVIQDVKTCIAKNQPVLVGTASIETSEYLSNLLKKEKIPHQVLNAKLHEKEAQIIAEAGRPSAITIATNMAGRGTDIVLGGNLESELHHLDPNTSPEEMEAHKKDWQKRHDQVVAAGGLHIIGSERHESRRIDNQLRGRAGRQGDPGSSRFYLSLQDNLMRIFASDRVAVIMQRLGMKEGEAIEHRWVSKAIENAQRKVEARNFDIRKQLLEYDDVANEQRKIIYEQRNALLAAEDIAETIKAIRDDVFVTMLNTSIPSESLEEQWDIPTLEKQLREHFTLAFPIQKWLGEDSNLQVENLRQHILKSAEKAYADKEKLLSPELMRQLEKSVMLQHLDSHWKEHLAAMDHLRQGIHLRGYAQKNPKQEYKRESFELFSNMLDRLKYDVLSVLYRLQIQGNDQVVYEMRPPQSNPENLSFQHENIADLLSSSSNIKAEIQQGLATETAPQAGRNDPCPCGSGRKFKQCHGQLA